MRILIGTSGWSYDHWYGGVLYPEGTPPQNRLDHYQRRYQTVELNSSYYRWPGAAAFARWRDRLPEGFALSVKAPRLLTHFQRLYSPDNWLAKVDRDLASLGNKMGVFLVQTPPTFSYDHARLAYFLDHLPAGRRVTMEFRHPSWHREEVFRLLERRQVAYCVMSGAHLPCELRATADFVYVRLHGPDRENLYAGSYSEDDLRWWADRIREWAYGQGRDVFVYFNNDGGGNAVRNADTLKWLLG